MAPTCVGHGENKIRDLIAVKRWWIPEEIERKKVMDADDELAAALLKSAHGSGGVGIKLHDIFGRLQEMAKSRGREEWEINLISCFRTILS